METLAIDIETYSSEDLGKCGVYRYAESPDFAVLLFAYSVDGGDVQCVDLASGERLPDVIATALTDPTVVKTAYNASFERVCLSVYLGRCLDPAQWRCTMVRAARLGFPLGLEACAEALGTETKKMKEGSALIRYFSRPSAGGHRHMPSDAPDRWQTFKDYCKRDVETEQAILRRIGTFGVPEAEQRLWEEDQRINDRGVAVDLELVSRAVALDEEHRARLLAEAREVTGLENPNSATQLKEWLRRLSIDTPTLTKQAVADLMPRISWHKRAHRALEIRLELSKSSNAKYRAIMQCVCRDGRVRGLMQFYGSRTGRWAGRLVQVQNLPQNHIEDLAEARARLKSSGLDEFELYYPVSSTLSELIRTAFVAAPGHVLHVCDFSAIEARVIAWLAGEDWALDVFRQGGDLYCATASQMFGVPVEKHGQNAHLRQRGKIAVLALGYGGGVKALEAMGGSRLGLSEEEMAQTVKLWRSANPRIVRLWRTVEETAITVIRHDEAWRGHKNRPDISRRINRGVVVDMERGMLTFQLPSGRRLCYPRAKIELEEGRFGEKEGVTFESQNSTTKRWERQRTYGGKLVENLVQAIARDLLGVVIMRAAAKGLRIVFHVHDEVVVEAPLSTPLSILEEIFDTPVEWCPGLPLKGAGYTTEYYIKD